MKSLHKDILKTICSFCDRPTQHTMMNTSRYLCPIAGSVFVQEVTHFRSHQKLAAFCEFVMRYDLARCIKYLGLRFFNIHNWNLPAFPDGYNDEDLRLREVLNSTGPGLKCLSIDVRVLAHLPQLRAWLTQSSPSLYLELLCVNSAVELGGLLTGRTNLALNFNVPSYDSTSPDSTSPNIADLVTNVLLSFSQTVEQLCVFLPYRWYPYRTEWLNSRVYTISWPSLKSLRCSWEELDLLTAQPCPSLRRVVIPASRSRDTCLDDLSLLDVIQPGGSLITSLTLTIDASHPKVDGAPIGIEIVFEHLFKHGTALRFLSLTIRLDSGGLGMEDLVDEANDRTKKSFQDMISRGDWKAPSLRYLSIIAGSEIQNLNSWMLGLPWIERFPSLEYLDLQGSTRTWYRRDGNGKFNIVSQSEGILAYNQFDWEDACDTARGRPPPMSEPGFVVPMALRMEY